MYVLHPQTFLLLLEHVLSIVEASLSKESIS